MNRFQDSLRQSSIFVSAISGFVGLCVSGVEIFLGIAFLKAPAGLEPWQYEMESQLIFGGGGIMFWAVTFSVAKSLYKWKSSEERRAFETTANSVRALQHFGMLAFMLLAFGLGIWSGWFVRPSLAIGIILLALSGWELYRAWKAERKFLFGRQRHFQRNH